MPSLALTAWAYLLPRRRHDPDSGGPCAPGGQPGERVSRSQDPTVLDCARLCGQLQLPFPRHASISTVVAGYCLAVVAMPVGRRAVRGAGGKPVVPVPE